MNFSKSELLVMEMLWDGDCLDENGEIQAQKLSNMLSEKYGFGKTSNYTYFSRLLEKGAITRRYPKYTIKPVVTREEALREKHGEVLNTLFKGSMVKLVSAFLNEKKPSKEELQEMRALLDSFGTEE